ncbi:hypothetical protein BJ170DRAFT_615712 [Xylariales sp. AK1849]|nr:hypothetical protein BJ170DRAFT_615712 [Xylariales sp. AK1849]
MISESPTGVGIAVQVISQLLGLILVQTICITLNLSVRLTLTSRSLTLETLKLFNSLCGNRIDWTIKHIYLLVSITFVALTMVPAALWAGAITPAITTASARYALNVPDYSNSYGILGDVFDNGSYTTTESLGTFTFFPEFNLHGFVLDNARDAINPTGGVNSHAKLDKTGYLYAARSFGAGALVGLKDHFETPALTYQFREAGLKVSTKCMYNETSRFILDKFEGLEPLGLSFNIYNSMGLFPNGGGVMDAATAMADSLAFTFGASSINNSHYAGTAVYPVNGNISANSYAVMDKVQCQIFFDPYEFLVSVNTTSKYIDVVPQDATRPFPNSNILAMYTIQRLGRLASVLIMSQWTSVMGNVLKNNIENIARINGNSSETTLRGVGTAIESMCDNILEATSAAQMMVLGELQPTTAEVQSMSFVLGSPIYAYGILGVNLFVTLIFLVEVLRTRMWKDTPLFDFVDIKAVILHSSFAGNSIILAGYNRHSEDEALGEVNVTFVDDRSGTGLSLTESTARQGAFSGLYERWFRSRSSASTKASFVSFG